MQDFRKGVSVAQKGTEDAPDYNDLLQFIRQIHTQEFTKVLAKKYSSITINTHEGRKALWDVLFKEDSLDCVISMAYRREKILTLEWEGLKQQLLESLSDWIVESVTNAEHCFMKRVSEAHDNTVIAFVAILNNNAEKRVLQLLRQFVRDGKNVSDKVVYLESMEIAKDTQQKLILGTENNSQMELLVEIACWVLLEMHATMPSTTHDTLMMPRDIYVVESTFEMRLQRTHYYCPGIWSNVRRVLEKMKSIVENEHNIVPFESIRSTWPASRLLLNSLSILYILLADEPVEDPTLLRVKRIMESSNRVFLYSIQNKMESIRVLWNCIHGSPLWQSRTMRPFGRHSLSW